MRRGIEPRTVRSFCRRRATINFRPDEYQRGAVWSNSQKQLLIDSILRDLDIPKVYLREIKHEQYKEEVVDGQQRLLAIWGFYNNEFKLSKDADKVGDQDIAGKKFEELDEDIKDDFESYALSIVTLREATSDDVAEMFLRLQNGTTLNAAEKRNAMPGDMKYFVRELAQHPFFNNCGFRNHRFAFDHVSAQMLLSELKGEICNVKNTDLSKMYEENKDFDTSSTKAKKIKQTLDFLYSVFPSKTPELKKFNAISMYLLSRHLLENFAVKDRAKEIGDWFIGFEQWRKEDEKTPIDKREQEMVAYLERTSHSTDAQDSLEYRHKILLSRLHQHIVNLKPLDTHRSFSEEQRIAIFRRDNGICQIKIKCDGKKCEWDNWHADHKVPWSKGGETTVENGQVACPECNLSKGKEISG